MDFGDTRYGFWAGIFLTAIVLFYIVGAIILIFDFIKRLSKKQTRKGAVKELTDSAKGTSESVKFFMTDKSFHKDLRREFRVEIILFSLIGLTLLLALFGIS